MKTRVSEPQHQAGLPPPPAPPARDANPWQMSAPRKAPATAPSELPPLRKKGARPDLSRSVPSDRRPLSWGPVMILFALAGSGMAMAIEALQAGEVEAALGAILLVAFAAFIGWRRLRRRS